MSHNLAQKLIEAHLIEGEMTPGEEIGLRIDQTLTQDATGTLVMLELEAMNLDRVKTELSAQYVDHNLIQEDYKNADDHRFLLSASRRFGLWYSRAGNGVSHPCHQERFGKPGKTLIGSDSHTCAAGAIGMLAIGAGGLEVAMAMAGLPFHIPMPRIWGIHLTGELPPWVSAKDVILEMLRRHGVKGGVGRIIEYHGPGVAHLSAMDRHVIANMGAELGATTTVFPADEMVRQFLSAQGREEDFEPWLPDRDAAYDDEDEIDLSSLEPLIAMPSSPGNVKPVREVAGESIHQCYIGSSANPGYRDFAVAAEILRGRKAADNVSLDVNPASRRILAMLTRDSRLLALINAGARIHQAGCNGCIGMGQAPATNTISLRTVPRNFPGRSGTIEDKVCLVSPETAAASALKGVITDPRDLEAEGMDYPRITEPEWPPFDEHLLIAPLAEDEAQNVELEKGPNIKELPELDELPNALGLKIILKTVDDISTDEILPAGTRVLPYRSNIPKISEFAFEDIDPDYDKKALEERDHGGHAVVGGSNYGQGSSREHAVLAPRYLGLRAVLAKDFARIHWQNLVNFGVLPLTFGDPGDYDRVQEGHTVEFSQLHEQIANGGEIEATVNGKTIRLRHTLSRRQAKVLLAGGLINWTRARIAGESTAKA